MKRYERRIEEKNYLVIAVKMLTDIAVAVGIAMFIFVHFFGDVKVIGTSMEPAFSDKDVLLLDTFSYSFIDIERYDVIAFTIDVSDAVYVKRIVGLPGETVQIKDGKVYIDNKVLKDDIFSEESILNVGVAGEKLILGEDEYFVLGDNRNNSEDSRSASIGNIKKENIIGKAWLEVTSLEEFGLVNKEE